MRTLTILRDELEVAREDMKELFRLFQACPSDDTEDMLIRAMGTYRKAHVDFRTAERVFGDTDTEK